MKKILTIFCLSLFSLIIFSGNVFAAMDVTIEGYNASVNFVGPYRYVMYKDTADDIRLLVAGNFWMSDTSIQIEEPYVSFTTIDDKSTITLTPNYRCGYANFILKDNVWEPVGGASSTNAANNQPLLMNSAVKEFLASTYPITLSNGDVVFPEPPAKNPTLEAIMGEVPAVQTTMIAAMRIIVLCGVGCLALLIGLKILPKILWKFLLR